MARSFDYLLKDLAFFGILATASFCVGFFINQFRDDPLGLIYQTKEKRIMAVVTRQKRESQGAGFVCFIAKRNIRHSSMGGPGKLKSMGTPLPHGPNAGTSSSSIKARFSP